MSDCGMAIGAGLLPPRGYRRPQHLSGHRPPDGEENENVQSKIRTVLRAVRLISAKTGYGVEELISALQRSWRYRGDVYLVGATYAGKSTLFSTLLESDYWIAKGAEAIDRATISPWAGKPVSLVYSCGFQLSSCFVGKGGYYISEEAHGLYATEVEGSNGWRRKNGGISSSYCLRHHIR